MLEWTTRRENMVHAVSTKQFARRTKIHMICPTTGKIIKIFDTLTEAVRAHFRSDMYFYKCLNNNNIEHDGYLWKTAEPKEVEIEFEDEIWVCLKDSIYEQINVFPKYFVSNYGRVKGHFGRILVLNKCNNMYFLGLTNDNETKSFKMGKNNMVSLTLLLLIFCYHACIKIIT